MAAQSDDVLVVCFKCFFSQPFSRPFKKTKLQDKDVALIDINRDAEMI